MWAHSPALLTVPKPKASGRHAAERSLPVPSSTQQALRPRRPQVDYLVTDEGAAPGTDSYNKLQGTLLFQDGQQSCWVGALRCHLRLVQQVAASSPGCPLATRCSASEHIMKLCSACKAVACCAAHLQGAAKFKGGTGKALQGAVAHRGRL